MKIKNRTAGSFARCQRKSCSQTSCQHKSFRHIFFLAGCCCCLLLALAPPATAIRRTIIDAMPSDKTNPDKTNLLETGGGIIKPGGAPAGTPDEIKIVSYNMRWRGGDELRELIGLLRDDSQIGGAAVIGLQEADRGKGRTDRINTARVMADALGMHYAWAAPPRANSEQSEDETGVAILSRYPLSDVERIVLPHEGPGHRRRVALGATVRLGATDVRVYTIHAETRVAMEKKMDQLRAVLTDLERYPRIERVVVLGDFNTIKQKDVEGARRVFEAAGFATPFKDGQATWRTFIIKLKLDWLWLRGFETSASGIARQVEMSDHWPLWVTVKFKSDKGRS